MSDEWAAKKKSLHRALGHTRSENPHLIAPFDVLSTALRQIAADNGVELNSDVLAGMYIGIKAHYASASGIIETHQFLTQDNLVLSLSMMLSGLAGLMETEGEFNI